MGTGYKRNDTTNNIADGNIISSADLDGEFNSVEAAFNDTTGHDHGGGVDNGAPITKVGPVQDVVISASAVTPKTDNTVDIGSATFEFKDLYIDGTANIDSLVADTADINGGTIDNATIATSDITVGTSKTLNVSAGTLTLADNQISGDKVEGGTIAAITITTLASTTGNITNVNATTVDATTVQVNNIKAKDGTDAATINDSTGVVTVAQAPVMTALTASQAVFTTSGKALVSNAITGTGNVVMSTSPTLVTPALGTPSSVTLTNATGLPVATGISGLGTGIATFLATPSSANLASAVTNETGSGALVFATSPTLVTPALGTPSSVTLTNATGLPTAGLVDNAVTNGKLRDSAALSVIGRSANSSGDPADIAAGTDHQVLRRSGTSVGFGAVALNQSAAITGTLPVGNGGTGITSFGTGIATFLGTPSSSNLAAAVTDETGTGALVFANSPALISPTLDAASATLIIFDAGTVSDPSITTTGDTDTGIFFPAADEIAFAAGGAEVMRIDSSKLNVDGQISGKYTDVGTNTAAQSLATNHVSSVTISANTTLTTTVPPAGTQAIVIIVSSGATSRTVTFGTGFASTGTLATGGTADRRFVVSFVSDGTRLLECSRTTAITV
jgi:hypothetical protein